MAETGSSLDPRALSLRKRAIAREILRRRREKKYEGFRRRHVWLAAAAAAVGTGLAVITRLWRRRPGTELRTI